MLFGFHLLTMSHCKDPDLSSYNLLVGAGGLFFALLKPIFQAE